jgi:GNAT superfamily N-acetyltransferase
MAEDSPSFVVREATERDADAIFDLICFKAEFDGCFSSVQATPRKLIAAMRGTSPYFRALLAETGGRAIGFASFHQTFSSFLAQPGIWLDDLFVRESYRARGVGNALMRRLAMLAGKNGCARIDWIVATSNIKARHFYTHIGSRVNEDVRHCRLDADAIARLATETAGAASRDLAPPSQPRPQAERRTLVRRSTAVLD